MPRSFVFNPVANRAAVELAVFGSQMTQDDYGELVGDIANDAQGTVEFNQNWATHNRVMAVTIRAQTSLFNTVIRIDPNEFHYCDIRVFVPNAGTGYRALRLLAAKAASYHFPVINASGSKFVSPNNPAYDAWGYYVYPKYGFDADIPAGVNLDPAFGGMTRIRQLMATPAGRTEWRNKGVQVNDLVFDLANGSYSWSTLNALPP